MRPTGGETMTGDSMSLREAELSKAIRMTLHRWAQVTGDGSMWGEDAYVFGPLREAIGEPLSEAEKASGDKVAKEFER